MKQIFHQSLSIFKLSCLPFSFVEQNVFIMYLMNLLMSMRPRVKEINVYSFFILCISIRESKKKSDKNWQVFITLSKSKMNKHIFVTLNFEVTEATERVQNWKFGSENKNLECQFLSWLIYAFMSIFENVIKRKLRST